MEISKVDEHALSLYTIKFKLCEKCYKILYQEELS